MQRGCITRSLHRRPRHCVARERHNAGVDIACCARWAQAVVATQACAGRPNRSDAGRGAIADSMRFACRRPCDAQPVQARLNALLTKIASKRKQGRQDYLWCCKLIIECVNIRWFLLHKFVGEAGLNKQLCSMMTAVICCLCHVTSRHRLHLSQLAWSADNDAEPCRLAPHLRATHFTESRRKVVAR